MSTFEEAVVAFRNGDINRAVDLFEQVTRRNPDHYDAFVYLGAAYAQQGRYNATIGALRRAADSKPDSPRIYYNLGQAYEAAGVPREAWFSYKKALELDPSYGLARGALIALSHRLPSLLSAGIEFTTY